MPVFNCFSVLFIIFLLFFFTSYSIFAGCGLVLVTLFCCYFYIKYRLNIKKHLFLWLLFLGGWLVFSVRASNPASTNSTVTMTVVGKFQNYYLLNYQWQTFYFQKQSYFAGKQQIINAEIDDNISLKPQFQRISAPNNFYQFNFQQHLAAINVNYQVLSQTNSSVQVHSRLTIRNLVWKFFNHLPSPVREYSLKLLLQSGIEFNLQPIFSQWGILALLTVSGFHINLLIWVLQKILPFQQKKHWQLLIILIMIGFYLYLINWAIAALRAGLMFLIQTIGKHWEQKFNKVNGLCFVTYLCLLIAPLQFYQLGWQLSFGINFLILLFAKKIKNYGRWQKIIIGSLLIFLCSWPIQMTMNQSISLFSIFYQIIFAPVIAVFYIGLILNGLLTVFWDCSFIMIWLLNLFESLVLIIEQYDWQITAFTPATWSIQIYYALMPLLYSGVKFFNWRLITIIAIKSSMISSLWVIHFVKPFYEITFLNVGNAMSILIVSPFQQSALMIDAGLEFYANQTTIYQYLRAKGIFQLDAIFITHNDSDHINNLVYLQQRLLIKQIYRNFQQQNCYYVTAFFPIINLSYSLQNWLINASENNRSLVLLMQFFNTTFLVTGDIEKLTENLLMAQKLITKVNILQVAHHGSNTSTSSDFLSIVQPDVAIISGRQQINRPFPHQETLKRLTNQQVKTYWTGKNKTIIVRIFHNYYQIVTFQ